MITALFLVVTIIFVTYYLYLRFNYTGRLLAKIPGPRGYPIVGHLFSFVTPSGEHLFKLFQNIGLNFDKIAKIYSFNVKYVCIYDPDDIELILSSTTFITKEVPYTFLKAWLGNGLLTSNGEKWQQRRKLLTPAFHFNVLRQFSRTFNEQTQSFIKRLEKEVGKQKTSVIPLVARATLNVMCETSMGTSMQEGIDSVSNKYFTSIYSLTQCVVYRLTRIWLYWEWLYNTTSVARTQKKSLKEAHHFTDSIIDGRRLFRKNVKDDISVVSNQGLDADYDLGKKHRLAMLDLLLEKEDEGKIDGKGIREEVDTFMFEGHDTTAHALSFMLMRIANEPLIQEKLFEEQYGIFGNLQLSPSVEQLNEMKYLECCIKESLRLYPSVPTIMRLLTKDVVLSGYTVPAGTKVVIKINDIHRREGLYPDPEKFIPERFSMENMIDRHRYAYLPFSAGPRNCIGQKFAIMEMKTVMSGVIRRFRLEPVTKPEDIVFVADLILKTKHPLYVRFVNRQT